MWPFFGKLLNSTVLWYCLICYTVGFWRFHLRININRTVWPYSFESYWTVLYCGTVCFTVQCDSNVFHLWDHTVTIPWEKVILLCLLLCHTVCGKVKIFSSVGSTYSVTFFILEQLNTTLIWERLFFSIFQIAVATSFTETPSYRHLLWICNCFWFGFRKTNCETVFLYLTVVWHKF